jgi:hypothetical protein
MKRMGKKLITADELRKALGEAKRVPEGKPPAERFIPPELLQRITSGELTEDEVILELERLGWRQVKHLFVAK